MLWPNTVVAGRLATAAALSIGISCLGIGILAPAPASAGDDAEMKAAFITKFAMFVTWPSDSFASAEAPIVMCTLDAGALAQSLQSVAPKARANDRSFEVRRIESAVDADGCHILVLGKADQRTRRRVATTLRGRSTLTVAAAREFTDEGGIVGMAMHKGKVAFEVNNRIARSSDLSISSRVLGLATAVH